MRKTIFLLLMLYIASMGFAQEEPKDSTTVRKVDEVIIHASRSQAKLKDLPAKVEVISCKEIQQSGTNDITDLLKNNTSVDLIQYPNFSSTIEMRGFSPGFSKHYTSILVDGVPAGTFNMSTLTLNGVKQIEILKGPFSALYGSNAMGGLINIVPMRNTEDLTGRVNFSYGSRNTMNASAAVGGNIAGGLSFDFSGFYNSRNDDYKIGENNLFGLDNVDKTIVDRDTYGATMKNTSYKTFGGNLRLGYDINDDWSIDLNGSYFTIKDVTVNNSFFDSYDPSEKDLSRYNTRLSVTGEMGSHLLKINPYYSSEEELVNKLSISSKLANKIISYREAHGKIEDINELKNIEGISDTLFERIKELLYVG